jgi:hypothetical protein
VGAIHKAVGVLNAINAISVSSCSGRRRARSARDAAVRETAQLGGEVVSTDLPSDVEERLRRASSAEDDTGRSTV